jgi:hypothetical protein
MRIGGLEQNGIIVAADSLPTPQDNVLLEGHPCLSVAQNQLDVLFKGGANDRTANGL